VFNTHQFRLNSAYDPDLTATGHQPLGFDQWASFYNHYVVDRVTWEMMVAPYSGTIPVLGEVGVHISDDSSISNYPEVLAEQGAQIQMRTYYANEPAYFTGDMDLKKFFNRTGDIANDGSLRAAFGANPTEIAVLSVFAQNAGGETCTYLVYLQINMHVKFFEPTDLPPSAYGHSVRSDCRLSTLDPTRAKGKQSEQGDDDVADCKPRFVFAEPRPIESCHEDPPVYGGDKPSGSVAVSSFPPGKAGNVRKDVGGHYVWVARDAGSSK
jgi:hypothetical protein